MALPRIDTPTYQTNLPSTGQEVQFRPFLVKEQKIIMMAQESGNEVEMTNALSQLVSTCTFNKIDVTFSYRYWTNLGTEATLPQALGDRIVQRLTDTVTRRITAQIPAVLSKFK